MPDEFRRRPRQRGSAMIEMVICLLPYGLLLLGVILLGHLALGEQEALMAVNWASSKPGQQEKDEVNEKFFRGSGDGLEFTEETPYLPTVDPNLEEPVLPYGTDGVDIEAAITRISNKVTQSFKMVDGELVAETVTRTTAVGNYLIRREINQYAADIARALGAWLTYSRSQVKYSYQLQAGRLPLEEESEGAEQFRDTFTLGEKNPEKFAYSAASINEEGQRGFHVQSDVDLPALADFDSDDGPVETQRLNQEFAVHQGNLPPGFPVFWNKDFAP